MELIHKNIRAPELDELLSNACNLGLYSLIVEGVLQDEICIYADRKLSYGGAKPLLFIAKVRYLNPWESALDLYASEDYEDAEYFKREIE